MDGEGEQSPEGLIAADVPSRLIPGDLIKPGGTLSHSEHAHITALRDIFSNILDTVDACAELQVDVGIKHPGEGRVVGHHPPVVNGDFFTSDVFFKAVATILN